ncbi:hypothetical protein QCE81_34940, partial [Caballeronia sp. LZ002]|nr:hypothetical protein [Caballeronia sp. LZ002]MDR5852474.1 hypothetical protein [Caballeronia sp. LZ003]
KALALIEASMARAGYTRAQRREAIKALYDGRDGRDGHDGHDGKPGAAGYPATPGAGDAVAASLRNLLKDYRFFHSQLVQFWNFLHSEPLFEGIVARLDAE